MRCTAYTRKSTEDGLEQEFNSLDAQRNANSTDSHAFWSLETVAARVSANEPGTVDDLLEDITLAPLRATLVYGSANTGNQANLQLRIYMKVLADFNERGFGMSATQDNNRIATTAGVGESVKLFDFTGPDLNLGVSNRPNRYYPQIRNTSTLSSQFGIAVFIPKPGVLFFFLVPAMLIAAALPPHRTAPAFLTGTRPMRASGRALSGRSTLQSCRRHPLGDGGCTADGNWSRKQQLVRVRQITAAAVSATRHERAGRPTHPVTRSGPSRASGDSVNRTDTAQPSLPRPAPGVQARWHDETPGPRFPRLPFADYAAWRSPHAVPEAGRVGAAATAASPGRLASPAASPAVISPATPPSDDSHLRHVSSNACFLIGLLA